MKRPWALKWKVVAQSNKQSYDVVTMNTPKIEMVLESHSRVGEGAVWSVEEQALYWVDIPPGHLNRFDPSNGENTVHQMPTEIGCFALLDDGSGAIVALNNGFHNFDFENETLTLIANPKADEPDNRFNDGTTDPVGRFLAGTMPLGEQGDQPQGSLYILDLDGSTRKLKSGLWIQNGLAFSPDGRTLYLADTNNGGGVIWAYDYDVDTGTPSNERPFVDCDEYASSPDGGTIDTDGCYWMAGVRGWELLRFTPDGELDRRIEMPVEKPSKIAFGGANLDVMYVTTIGNVGPDGKGDPKQPFAGCLFAIEAGVQGLPTPPARIFW